MSQCRNPSNKHRWKEDKSRDLLRCLDCGLVETLVNPVTFDPGREGSPPPMTGGYASGGIYSAEVSASMKRVTDSFASTSKNMVAIGEASSAVAADYATMLDRLGLSIVGDGTYTVSESGGRVSGNLLPPTPPPWTSEDALTLILEEIKHDPDPFTAAGKWLTRFTNGVTDITRNLDDDE